MLRKFLSYGLGEGVAKGLNIATILILPLFISVDNYGITVLIIAFEQILTAIFLFGQNIAILRFYNRFKKFEAIFFKSILRGYFKLGSTLLAIMIFLLLVMNNIVYIENYKLYLLCSVVVFLMVIQEFHLVFLRARERIQRFIFLRVLFQSIKFVLIIGFANFGFEENSYILGLFIAIIISLSISIYIFSLDFSLNFKFPNHPRLTTKMILFGAPLTLHALAGILYGVIDRYMLNWFIDENSVAIYSFSYSVGSSVFFVINIFVLTFLPDLYKNKNYTPRTEKMLRKYLTLCFLVVSSISALIYFVVSPVIIPSYYPEYVSGFPVLGLILLSTMVHPLYLYGLFKLTLLKLVKYIPMITIAALLVNVFLNVIFIPQHGIVGAAITTLISECFLGIMIATIAIYHGLKFRLLI